MNELRVTRLLQNPLGHVAPAGARGDIVRVTDGRATIYLDPDTFDTASEAELRTALARSTRSSTGQLSPGRDPARRV